MRLTARDELRTIMEVSLSKMWGQIDWSMRCEGCYSDNCYCKDDPYNAKGCVPKKKLSECRECKEFMEEIYNYIAIQLQALENAME